MHQPCHRSRQSSNQPDRLLHASNPPNYPLPLFIDSFSLSGSKHQCIQELDVLYDPRLISYSLSEINSTLLYMLIRKGLIFGKVRAVQPQKMEEKLHLKQLISVPRNKYSCLFIVTQPAGGDLVILLNTANSGV